MVTSIIHWKEPKELKVFNVSIICITNNGNIITFKTNHNKESVWLWHVEKYNIKYWCFQSEIIPYE